MENPAAEETYWVHTPSDLFIEVRVRNTAEGWVEVEQVRTGMRMQVPPNRLLDNGAKRRAQLVTQALYGAVYGRSAC